MSEPRGETKTGSPMRHARSGSRHASRLKGLFSPASVALVGVSADERKLSGRPLRFLRKHGYRGEIYVVNPRHAQIDGIQSYPRLSSLPACPETVVITLPADAVPRAIEESGSVGIRNAVILSAGFEEVAGSLARVRRIARAAERYAINVVGPNSEGVWAVPSRTILTFGSAAARRVIRQGPVSVLSQSGSIGGACVRRLQDLGIGCRYYVSTGNETFLTTVDYLEYLVADGKSSVILLFIEGLRDGWRLRTVAAAARRAGIQLLVLKAGQSDAGRRATQSHTGKFSTSGAVYSDLFRQFGAVELETVDELIAASLALTTNEGHRAGVGGVGVISVSGGSRSIIVDDCDRRGVPLATFRVATRRRLKRLLPREAAPENPVDPTGRVVDDPGLLVRVAEIVAEDPHAGSLLIQFPNWAWRQVVPYLPGLENAAAASGKPFVVATLTPDIRTREVAALRRRGLILARSTREAVVMLGLLTQHRAVGVAARSDGRPPLVSWDWGTIAGRVRRAGVPCVRTAVCQYPGELASALAGVGFPAVVKAASAYHKTDRGLVKQGIGSLAQAKQAAVELWSSLGEGAPLLIQTQAEPGVEVLLNLRRDPDWGPVLTLGMGGIRTELWKDAVTFGLPVTALEIRRGLASLKLQTLLDGHRGDPAADTSALLEAAVALGDQYIAMGDDVEIEINPLVVMPRGGGVVALDLTAWNLAAVNDQARTPATRAVRGA